MRDYLAMLEHSYQHERESGYMQLESRLEYLSECIFDFTTYSGDMGALFARKAVEVCAAISERATFDYIKDFENHVWFLVMCNMPFFATRIEWGTSVRGAYWTPQNITYSSFGLWAGDTQLHEPMEFTPDNWFAFCRAIVEFSKQDD